MHFCGNTPCQSCTPWHGFGWPVSATGASYIAQLAACPPPSRGRRAASCQRASPPKAMGLRMQSVGGFVPQDSCPAPAGRAHAGLLASRASEGTWRRGTADTGEREKKGNHREPHDEPPSPGLSHPAVALGGASKSGTPLRPLSHDDDSGSGLRQAGVRVVCPLAPSESRPYG
jgi:hypothetical protein